MHKARKHHTIYACPCLEGPSPPLGSRPGPTCALRDLLTLLDEKDRRIVAASLAKQHGRGGIALLARITGLSRNTIRRGLQEVTEPDAFAARVRRPGAGRKKAEKKMSAVVGSLGRSGP